MQDVSISVSNYSHSPAHLAVLLRDHAFLRRIVSPLPALPKAGEVTTEDDSLAGELTADAVSAVIDRRDVPLRETPLHLAVRLRDPVAAEILVSAGADWSLRNDRGWSALQEATCGHVDAIAAIIVRHYQPLAWAKWCRRLPRIVSSLARIRDFYMEASFRFESSLLPFVARIAPSDTCRIWKRGADIRADTNLAGLDGLRIQRSDRTFLFLGGGKEIKESGRRLPPGSLLVLDHKEKQVWDALEGAGAEPTEEEVAHEVASMSRSRLFRAKVDASDAELTPHSNWRRQESTEMVGGWKTKVFDMHRVMLVVRSRRVPGAPITKEDLFAADNELDAEFVKDDSRDTRKGEEEVKKELKPVLWLTPDFPLKIEELLPMVDVIAKKVKAVWRLWEVLTTKLPQGEFPFKIAKDDSENTRIGKEKGKKKKKKAPQGKHNKDESEYKKGLKPVLWLTSDFPLKTDELLPLLDVLADKVKVVRRLRDVLANKLPQGTFPVKIAIPIVPTIRALLTITKFEERQPSNEFATAVSSQTHFEESKRDTDVYDTDPFHIPSDYTWVDGDEKKREMKAKKAKNKHGHSRKQSSKSSEGQQLLDVFTSK
ncbi:uncharacterized protein [Typha latifolia]|uniref:uncharacterized protein n=1 Tax=Typha latifolia TaxID=4733 RepID=UPI003C2F1584